MNIITCTRLVLFGMLLTGIDTAVAQSDADDSADVWSAVERQWDADQKGDRNWVDRMLVEDFSGWDKFAPAPHSKASTKMWDRFDEQRGKPLAHELFPLSIVVNGDVAIAHYLYTQAFEDNKGEIEMNNGRYTDVLIRTEDGWKFLAWHGGDDK